MQGEIAEAQRAYEMSVETTNAAFAQFKITEAQKTELLRDAVNARLKAELDAAHTAQAALKANDDATLAAKQRVTNEIIKINQQANAQLAKDNNQTIQAYQQQWQSGLSVITGAFNSQLHGLLAGTETWSQAFKNILADLIIRFIEFCEQMVVKWLATQVALAVASNVTGASAGNKAAIAGDVGQAFAGFAAYFAPTLGPNAIPVNHGDARLEHIAADIVHLAQPSIRG